MVQFWQVFLFLLRLTTENELKPKQKKKKTKPLLSTVPAREILDWIIKIAARGEKVTKYFVSGLVFNLQVACVPLETPFYRNCCTTCNKENGAWLFHSTEHVVSEL